MIAVTKHEVTISKFNITDQNKSFEIYTPRYWQDNDIEKKEFEEKTSSNQSKLHVEEATTEN